MGTASVTVKINLTKKDSEFISIPTSRGIVEVDKRLAELALLCDSLVVAANLEKDNIERVIELIQCKKLIARREDEMSEDDTIELTPVDLKSIKSAFLARAGRRSEAELYCTELLNQIK